MIVDSLSSRGYLFASHSLSCCWFVSCWPTHSSSRFAHRSRNRELRWLNELNWRPPPIPTDDILTYVIVHVAVLCQLRWIELARLTWSSSNLGNPTSPAGSRAGAPGALCTFPTSLVLPFPYRWLYSYIKRGDGALGRCQKAL